MKRSLYDIRADYEAILAEIEDAYGEVTPEQIERLGALDKDYAAKVDAYGAIIKQYKADAEMAKKEKQRLAERQATFERIAERMQTALAETMQVARRDKYESATCKVSFRSVTSLSVMDESLVPDEFFKVERTPKKSEITAAIKAGTYTGGGVDLVEDKRIWVR